MIKKEIKIMVLFLFCTLTLSQALAEICINEIMANPLGSDNNKEFIEITGTNNLSEYTIGDNVQIDSLELLQFSDNCNFSLIVEENFDYSNLTCSIYSAGSSIGNGLSNDFDDIYFYNNSSLVDQVSYTQTIEGYSYSKLNQSWVFSELINGTPCENNYNNLTYNNSEVNQTDEINYTSNETINGSALCNLSIDIELDEPQSIYSQGNKIKFKNLISDDSLDFIIEYWITDYFNQTFKSKVNTSNSNQKQWTINIDSLFSILVIRSKLIFVDCQSVVENMTAELIFIATNPDEFLNQEESSDNNESEEPEDNDEIEVKSSVEFETISYDNNKVNVLGEVYKGDTAKRLFKFYVQCNNSKNKLVNSEEIKFYLSKYETLQFDETIYLYDIIDECYNRPALFYEGIELEGSEEIDNLYSFYNLTINSSFVKNDSIFSLQIQNLPALIFSYDSEDVVESKYFTKKNPSNSSLEIHNSNLITGYSTLNNNKNTNNNVSERIEPNSKKIINFIIVGLLILSLIIILLKK